MSLCKQMAAILQAFVLKAVDGAAVLKREAKPLKGLNVGTQFWNFPCHVTKPSKMSSFSVKDLVNENVKLGVYRCYPAGDHPRGGQGVASHRAPSIREICPTIFQQNLETRLILVYNVDRAIFHGLSTGCSKVLLGPPIAYYPNPAGNQPPSSLTDAQRLVTYRALLIFQYLNPLWILHEIRSCTG
jgi:hypothetical protein